ncbi:GRB2-related adapter protein [Salmo salar]|uniref:GRB2-related adapter protein n=1 Tax=Salmo salar TaxID=8030 RepID=A0A1S3R6V6_SALSA|nr:GRB2-related adapter protein [Salmo salar]|eukprot:XP_014047861.1 PREDICTED: GRB2-related adapter protein-like [Salmo salar]
MEAVAVFSFRATERDELSFQKGEILKVTEMDEDPNWMMAELHGRRGYVPENYISLLPHPWFAGRVSRQQAEQRLRWEERGVFLVRESESSPGEFSVSVSYGDMVEHFLVLEGLGQYCVWEETFTSLNRLVDFYRSHSIAQERTVYLTEPPDTPLHTHTPAHPLTHTAVHLQDPNPNPYTPLRTHTHTANPYLAEHPTHTSHPHTHHTPNTHPTHTSHPHTHHTHTSHPSAGFSKRREPSKSPNWGYSAPT